MANIGELDRLAIENAELRRRLEDLERNAATLDAGAALRTAIHATGVGLWSWEVGQPQPIWDESMRCLHGCSETPSVERYLDEIVHPVDRFDVLTRGRRLLESGRWDSGRYRIVRPDGGVRWVLTSASVVAPVDGKPLRLVGGMLDVTEQRALQEQLRQLQKMEAVSVLTAGIAHNFNNMLAVIMPTLEVAQRLLPNDRKPILREASHAARRASELARRLMSFARETPANQRAHHSSHEIVEAAVDICARALEPDIRLSTSFACSPVTLWCDAGQLEQVLVNLLLNARDAVRAAGPPREHVNVHVSLERANDCGAADTDASLYIQVSDDGIGMTEAVKARAFEPFFTTKDAGRGTGLGLATSSTIVRDHQGRLECSSHAGLGTTFTIVLPVARTLPAALVRPTSNFRPPAPRSGDVFKAHALGDGRDR